MLATRRARITICQKEGKSIAALLLASWPDETRMPAGDYEFEVTLH